MNVTLTQEQISKIEAAILEIPAKYAIPIIQLISGFIQSNAKPLEVEEAEVV